MIGCYYERVCESKLLLEVVLVVLRALQSDAFVMTIDLK